MAAREAAIAPYAGFLARPAPEIIADLESYAQLLRKWQVVQNLVSRETLAAVWSRHFADSLQVLKLLRPSDRHIVDLGSGGGFPALPLAIALKGMTTRFTLVEPNSRKVSFLRTVARELDLAVTVESRRSEAIDGAQIGTIDVITARALASLDVLCGMAQPLFGPQTRAIFHKGREHLDELAESRLAWAHDVLIIPSDTDPNGVLLELTNLSRKNS